MTKKKYAIVPQPGLKVIAELKAASAEGETSSYREAHARVMRGASSAKGTQTQHRQAIQKTLVDTLKTAKDENTKKDAIRAYEQSYEKGLKNTPEMLEDRVTTALGKSAGPTDPLNALKKAWRYEAAKVDGVDCLKVMVSVQRPNVAAEGKKLTWSEMSKVVMGPEVVVAHVYLDDDRFVEDKSITDTAHPVYKNRQTNREYVRDSRGVFMRRYQTRAINEDDLKKLRAGSDLKSKFEPGTKATHKEADNYPDKVKLGQDLTQSEDIFFHLQRGDQRYISLTSTKHAIFGNGGDAFVSLGLISVDLAQVPKDDIVDVHDPAAARELLSVGIKEFSGAFEPYKPGFQPTDGQRAVRDTVRTRETLVKGTIPFGAVRGMGAGGDGDYSAPADPVVRAETAWA